jgi:outer membrane protein assembly factor BamB
MFFRILICSFLLLGLLQSLAACSTFTELRQDFADKVLGREPPNPPADLEDIQPTYTAKVDWSSNVGPTDKYDYTPALDASVIYDANAKGELVKLDANTGRQIWQINVGEQISGGVGIGTGIVLVGTSKGNLFAYDVNGKQVWKAHLSSEILSVPRYFDGVVIARAGDNHIFGLDATDGSRKWVYERINPALTLHSSVGLVVDSGAVYAGFAGGKLVAIRADNGKLIWEATVAQPRGVTEIERIADITSLPVVDGPLVYAVAYQGKIAAIDRASGRVVWNRDISSYSGLSAEDAKIFVSHTLGAVYSLDYTSGKTFWRQGDLSNRRLTAPLPMGNVIAVGDLEGYLHFLSREEGKFTARIKLDSNAVMSVIAGTKPNQLIAETRAGGLYAISVSENAVAPSSSKPNSSSQPQERPEAAPAKIILQEPESNNAPTLEPSAEPASESSQKPSQQPTAEPNEERSILFQKNDSILFPQDSTDSNAPGIKLPIEP